jgi:YegS/Rv2252/BmrU family lipid kinase
MQKGTTVEQMAIIINGGSGEEKDEALLKELHEALQSHGIDAKVHLSQQGEEIIELARRALHDGCETIVAGGGDGTINAVASVVVGTEATFGVLPLGTLNHFAKDLGIPLDIEGAVANLAEGEVMEVDVGEVNGRIFLNNSSIGLYPSIVQRREAQERLGRGKWWALLRATLTMLGRYPFFTVRVSADGKEIVARTPIVFIGNNEYTMHGFNLGTRSKLNGGCLSLYMPRKKGRFSFLWLAVRALVGRLRDADDFEAMNMKELTIEVDRRRVAVARDGEVTGMQTPLHYRCRTGELRVIVPRKKSEDES